MSAVLITMTTGLRIAAWIQATLAEARTVCVPDSVVVEAMQPGPVILAETASLSKVIANLRAWIMGILAAVATLYLVVGGVRYLVAGGDPGEVERAKSALKSALIGYGLAVLAPVLLTVLKNILHT